ncbi:BgTH12-02876 [Blumeria graminis f. sp. triticale]|uniref:AP-3 complex subunit delta n=1 Tax=Blumeria graminis f. sp. triticale TaxID=1689686 RepID=A0A9W4D2Q0_BLUGR|nr:BgTH12-02876 [Blumeria graminis f. sp. triticale]
MFEKSLYDLIRGLRNYRGNEKEYIQNSLKECRAEIRGQDMDLKATALLKLIYLEMFGYDMSWAAFHVLEVMSSAKYLQKRAGYLGAVQTFRPDTEVLMLATNLLKKDLTSTSTLTMSLPIATLPHVITPSLALSTLGDLLPRMNHSNPTVRKKTIITLYRLALVHPETLRPAWPKIKDRLADESEDPSVVAAIVNVVCELGWRRPQDFLSLAPRLFGLLVDGRNNWMAIKLIKLFAILTPLEPRLVKKLLPPLASIIRTTPAMSLLYECINGIIQGGILSTTDESAGGEEIATLCVSKLRGMIMVEGDANLKYVALIAFNKIVVTHPHLVAQQQDVIMECIDSPDISIRMRALDLVVEMVNSENLTSIVCRLMRQLKHSRSPIIQETIVQHVPVQILASTEDEPEGAIRYDPHTDEAPIISDEYKIDVMNRIINMCSSRNYGNLLDFEWYLDILIQIFRTAPDSTCSSTNNDDMSWENNSTNIPRRIANELRNIAVKVEAVRDQATRASELILLSISNNLSLPLCAGNGALDPASWVVGEFASSLSNPESTMTSLLQIIKSTERQVPPITSLQAVPKIFYLISGDDKIPWTAERKTMVSLIIARIIFTYEPLALHPSLEVQERAVEFLEFLKLLVEALSNQETYTDDAQHPPLLLTEALPSLFSGFQLNSVAPSAIKNVPLPDGLDLDQIINPNLVNLLNTAELETSEEPTQKNFDNFYHHPEIPFLSNSGVITSRIATDEIESHTYQHQNEESYFDSDILSRRRIERMEKNKDDPFYITPYDEKSGISTHLQNILQQNKDTDLDLDKIPIINLDLGRPTSSSRETLSKKISVSKIRSQIAVAPDETLVTNGTTKLQLDSHEPTAGAHQLMTSKSKLPLLQVDSSHISSISLEDDIIDVPTEICQQQKEQADIEKAMKEIERLRLQMQRSNERIEAAQGIGGTVIVKKKKKAKLAEVEDVAPTLMTKKKKTHFNPAKEKHIDQNPTAEGLKKKSKKKLRVKKDENAAKNA